MNNKRKHNRTPHIEVVELIDNKGELSLAMSRDLSEGGMFLKDTSKDIGDEFVLTYILGCLPVQCDAMVVRKCSDGIGLKFFDDCMLTNEKRCL